MAERAGFVSLVGAGPGDPSLITVGGAARLAEADVVVHDRLVHPALLAQARAGVLLIDASKSPERHTLTQQQINAALIEHARAGRRVVRLKGGDPFVFGRGGEEAQALRDAAIPFEVIPGVTSAVAAPAYAGIPVTHRGLASSFAVVTGHEDPVKEASSIDWPKLATAVDTLVFLMGASRLRDICARLIEHGRAPDTPAAVVEWGTLPRQRTIGGTLVTIADLAARAGVASPAVTVVGEVARLRGELRWYDNRALSGKRVLVTRTRAQASQLSRLLAERGAEPVELPTIEIRRTADPVAVTTAVEALRTSAYGWCVFTSANAADIFFEHLAQAGLDARSFARSRVAAIGAGTAAALARHGVRADLVPARYIAEGLAEAFAGRNLRGQRVLLPRAKGARATIVEALRAQGAAVDELLLYVAAVPSGRDTEGLRRLRDGEIDVATFASSSAVRNLLEMLGGDVAPLRGVTTAAIGPITARAVEEAGLTPAVVADTHTVEGLVAALIASYTPAAVAAER